MKKVYGYIRVSTPRQGEYGVSLPEQRDAILRYSAAHDLDVVKWFEERETAAKTGRRQFNEMLASLNAGAVSGVIIHKVDRSARNIKDWGCIDELLDYGIDVYVANEHIDLKTRGGRLAAGVEAVVAADYSRNLREEVKKGFYGRLKQGLYPRPAPLGYQDNGAGKPKSPHPVHGPLVRTAFDLYSTGQYSIDRLLDELYERGLRSPSGKRLCRTPFANVLHNPFYIGIIRLRTTGETFQGAHAPLISKDLFERVQRVLSGKAQVRTVAHDHTFRRTLTCAVCGRSLTGELQKQHVYYRCHGRICPPACIRQESVDLVVEQQLKRLGFTPGERKEFQEEIARMENERDQTDQNAIRGLKLQLDAINSRLQRLTDLLIDGLLDQASFAERKETLLVERVGVQERLKAVETGDARFSGALTQLFELSDSAWLSYKLGTSEKKREILKTVSSNRTVSGKILCVELRPVFQLVAMRPKIDCGGPRRAAVRTFLTRLSDVLVRSALGLKNDGGENIRQWYKPDLA